MPTSLKKIAEILNISISTVSKALKNYNDVSKETKRKVRKVAQELNYVPNTFAVTLRTHQSKTIGVIIPTTVHHFFSKIIEGIVKVAETKGYLVILLQSNEKVALEKKQIDLLLNKGVDGIMISLSNETNSFEHLEKVKNRGTPLVLFDKITKSINCSKVVIDDKKSAYQAVCYLVNKGHRRIAHFRGGLNPQNSIDRFLGYRKALDDNGIPYDSSLVYLCNNNADYKDGYNSAKKLIEDHTTKVDAIFAITDVIAIGAMKYFEDKNIKVPKDIAVLGFSNWFMSSIITPSLTTVNQPAYEMGVKSVEILIEEIYCKNKGVDIENKKLVIPTNLIIRNST
ncbi:MAG: LacI family DNA-binding transcriptional regulator [Tenacibaculum sp.]